jgi:beta-glucosidase/6-phospho-beta-glucosidase/beta-galactosidase
MEMTGAMIRIVSYKKAILAGIAASVAWELLLRPLLLAGVPTVDIVRMLGLAVIPHGPAWAWWMAGMALHVVVGVIWAVFYAYFFWSVMALRPLWQGLLFSLVPTVLATSVVYPQLSVMHAATAVVQVDPWQLFAAVSWGERRGLLLGHLIYGAVLGVIYTHPVGYPAARPIRLTAPPQRPRSPTHRQAPPRDDSSFIFATGVECSYPTIEGGRWRRDQMAATEHYRHWKMDLQLCVALGLSHLRYGPPLHLTYLARDRYDWSFVDQVMAEMHEINLTPIVDLCHFGVPAWLENFQNPELPDALTAYAEAFARRYPWVRFYTPINEMYVCAKLSALDGVWNEQKHDERSFVTAVRHLAKANVVMMQAILRERPDAVFVNSESGEYFQPSTPDPNIVRIADFENERRFLPLDLIYSKPVSENMRAYLRDNGMPDEEYAWFAAQATPRRCILGVDYYVWNEKLIDTRGRPQALGELFGWYRIASQYWERYHRPMMHTETNYLDAREAPRWLWRQWYNVQLIQKAGVPIVGFTWYSLTDQADWDIALSEALGNVNPVGLFDLNREPRTVAQAYKHLIATFGEEPALRDCPALRELLK